jgi:nucleotide-binding universal stress UspA family protein
VERALLVDSPGHGVVAAAEKAGADLIVVGARGLGKFKRVLLGSVSERVIHNATCPVLVVKAGARSSDRGEPAS